MGNPHISACLCTPLTPTPQGLGAIATVWATLRTKFSLLGIEVCDLLWVHWNMKSWVVFLVNLKVTIFSFEYGFQTLSAGFPWVQLWNPLKMFNAHPRPGSWTLWSELWVRAVGILVKWRGKRPFEGAQKAGLSDYLLFEICKNRWASSQEKSQTLQKGLSWKASLHLPRPLVSPFPFPEASALPMELESEMELMLFSHCLCFAREDFG